LHCPVTISDIKKAIHALVQLGSLTQLIIFFSGHGILLGPENELWLLSKAPSDPNEAVLISGSMAFARNSGIPHIIVFSDACRSRPTSSSFHNMLGAAIFPNCEPRKKRPEIDIFYATSPGKPALELPTEDSVKNYEGIFTKCVLEGLSGKVPTVLDKLEGGSAPRWVIPARKLSHYLHNEVLKLVEINSLQLQQYPEGIIQSHPPTYLVEVLPPQGAPLDKGEAYKEVNFSFALPIFIITIITTVTALIGMSGNLLGDDIPPEFSKAISLEALIPLLVFSMPIIIKFLRDSLSQTEPIKEVIDLTSEQTGNLSEIHVIKNTVDLMSEQTGNLSQIHKLAKIYRQSIAEIGVEEEFISIRDVFDFAQVILPVVAQTRDSMKDSNSNEIRTGFTVIGIEIDRVIISRNSNFDRFLVNDTTQICLYENAQELQTRSILLQFVNGQGVLLPVFSGYVGTIIVQDGHVLTVNYTPSFQIDKYAEYESEASLIEERRLITAVLADNGLFRLEHIHAAKSANYLRVLTSSDMTLGLYTAYAYLQSGSFEGLESVYHALRQEPYPLPFDIVLLAQIFLGTPPLNKQDIASFCPLLTQGWSFLDLYQGMIPAIVHQIRQHRVPALWTTFDSEGVNILWSFIQQGDSRFAQNRERLENYPVRAR
jgi:hypothetical protein